MLMSLNCFEITTRFSHVKSIMSRCATQAKALRPACTYCVVTDRQGWMETYMASSFPRLYPETTNNNNNSLSRSKHCVCCTYISVRCKIGCLKPPPALANLNST